MSTSLRGGVSSQNIITEEVTTAKQSAYNHKHNLTSWRNSHSKTADNKVQSI